MKRAESIKFKLMPDGHIRGFRTNRPDLPGVSEMQIYPTHGISPTITVAHEPKILITDEALAFYLRRCFARQRSKQPPTL
ncbi:MAG: hypothetical protein NC411_10650 [Bacteroides sp.]|nr:hypothetical protein [Bacteroides sp.]